MVKFLDTTLDTNTGLYYPYRKPGEETSHVNKFSKHPHNVLVSIAKGASGRITTFKLIRLSLISIPTITIPH